MESGELKFLLSDEEVVLNLCRSIKYPNNMRVIYVINVVYVVMPEIPIEAMCVVGSLAAVTINFDEVDDKKYDEMVHALASIGSYTYAIKKLDLN